jgi:hypothetical protein
MVLTLEELFAINLIDWTPIATSNPKAMVR